jgi:multidrug resistance efflux pump
MDAPTQNESQSEKKRWGEGRWWAVGPIIAAALVVIGVAATKIAGGNSSEAAVGVLRARRGDLNIVVTEGGSIRARNSIQYRVEVERRGMRGDLTILSVVPAGTYVTQEDVDNGMILVELDASSLEDQLTREEMELAGDQEALTAAKEAYDIQVIQNESDIASALLRVRFTLLDLQKYVGEEIASQMVDGISEMANLSAHVAPFIEAIRNDPNLIDGSAAGQSLKRYNDNIVLAHGNLATANMTLEGTERLHEANYVSALDLERDRLAVQNREFSRQNAQLNLDLFLAYDLPKGIEQNLSNYIEAGRQLERTYAQCRSRLARAQARLGYRNSRHASQLQRVEEVKQQIANCTIRARAPGLVVYGAGDRGDAFRRMRRRGRGSGIIAEGESVYTGQVLISVPNTAAMVAEISVHETEIDKVRPGQPARIVMDAFPDRVLQGQVLEVAMLPDRNRNFLNPDLRVYRALVQIDGTHDFLKTRMSCQVDILAQELKDVLVVPVQVVASRRGAKIVYVQTADGPEDRKVTTGAFNDMFVQIVEGLREGEEVLVNPPLFAHAANMGFEQDLEFGPTDPNLLPLTVQQRPAQRSGGRQGTPGGEMSREQRQQLELL